jgi:hypothetical protein
VTAPYTCGHRKGAGCVPFVDRAKVSMGIGERAPATPAAEEGQSRARGTCGAACAFCSGEPDGDDPSEDETKIGLSTVCDEDAKPG